MLLLTRPDHDRTVRYISAWAEDALKLARKRNRKVAVLDALRATRAQFESILKKRRPDIVFLNGHGSADCVCGQDDEVLVQAGKNERALAGTVTYALSCSSARALGPAAVAAGAYAYIGYTDDFIFVWEDEMRTHPRQDKTAALFLDPSARIPDALVKGESAGEAVRRARVAFAKNIRSLLASTASAGDTANVRYLVWDMRQLSLVGDSDACV